MFRGLNGGLFLEYMKSRAATGRHRIWRVDKKQIVKTSRKCGGVVGDEAENRTPQSECTICLSKLCHSRSYGFC